MTRPPADSEDDLPEDEGFRWFQDALRKMLNPPEQPPRDDARHKLGRRR
jgi:hypothetical protein